MTQTENVPSSDPFSREELAKKDLHSLELLLEISERNLESKILERDKASKKYRDLDAEFSRRRSGPNFDRESGPFMDQCRAAGNENHRLNVEIEKMHKALLPIREAIVAKRNPL